MKPSPRPVALITGASAGIGRELARVFARRYDLVLVARREELLRELVGELRPTGATVHIIAEDLTLADAPRRIFEQLRESGVAVHTLVNNAGFATYGPFARTSLDEELQLIALNISALTQLTKLFLPPMLERRQGRILNLASTAAFQPGPWMAVYFASKAYVLHFSEALAEELEGSGVTVSALCPGPTESEFQRRAAMQNSRLVQGELMSAHEVAVAGYRGMLRGRRVIIPGARARSFVQLLRVLPRRATTQIVKRAQAPVSHTDK